MFEMIFFNLLAVTLVIIMFFKMIKRNDTIYLCPLFIEAIGIVVSFITIKFNLRESNLTKAIMYTTAVILPLAIILYELRGNNLAERASIFWAKFLLLIGDKKAAKAVLVKLVSKYPDSYLGHRMLAEIYEKEGGMRKAIDEYVQAVDVKKNDYKSYLKIAELLISLGKKEEAIEMLEDLLKNKPDCYEASLLLGELLMDLERFKEAEKVYEAALIYKPNDWELYYCLGIIYTRMSDFQKAKEMYERAAEINHRLYAAYYNLGQIAFIQKDYDTAETYYENSLYGDYEAKSYYQLAKIYCLKGEKDKAINFLNKAIELDPRLLKKASREKILEPIKQFITVSVKMTEEKEDVASPESKEDGEEQETEITDVLLKQEMLATQYLEQTMKLIEQINENTDKQRIKAEIESIFEKEKKLKEEQERERKEREERQKQIIKGLDQKTRGTKE